MKFLLTAAPSALAVLLSGCGSSPSPATTESPSPATTGQPEPIPPATSVRMAWNNHFDQFAAMNEDKIMADYDEESVVAVYNDACTDPNNQLVAEYTGMGEIKAMFKGLFDTLGRNIDNVKVESFGENVVNPICEPDDVADTSLPDLSNVFLVWSAVNHSFTHATDTFTWKDGYKVKKQNIVLTEPDGACAGANLKKPADPSPGLITAGWDNHFKAFGDKNVTLIMKDYTDLSVIRIWDNTKSVYSVHTGLDEIETMFTQLFAAISAEGDGSADSEGIKVPLISVTPQYNSVLLVWESFSNPKATDTFIFTDEGKIIRQNIVTSSKALNTVVAIV